MNDFNLLRKLIRSSPGARRSSLSQKVNYFFTKLMTGNKSGALLLTTFVLMLGAANEQFTEIRAVSAVQDGNGLPKLAPAWVTMLLAAGSVTAIPCA
jgi:hypothetical protein